MDYFLDISQENNPTNKQANNETKHKKPQTTHTEAKTTLQVKP